MFDEENLRLAVRLLIRNNLDVNKSEIIADMLEYYPERRINRWLRDISLSSDPDFEFDHLLIADQSSAIKPRKIRQNAKKKRSYELIEQQLCDVKDESGPKERRGYDLTQQQSCGVKDESGLEGRYSVDIDFAQLYDDPNVYYGTWEETPPARRRFR